MWRKYFKNMSTAELDRLALLFDEVDRTRLPQHTAIIMDGNGRWASGRGMLRNAGHSAGVDALKNVLNTALSLELPVITVYAFSTENWKRPPMEVDYLMRLFFDRLMRELDELDEDNMQIRFMGRLDELTPTLKELLRVSEQRLAKNTGLRFNVAINYGGQDEILLATKKLMRRVQAGELSPEDVNEKLFENCLYTEGMPPVDLVIRTSGDMRLSNFLLWQTAYAELWFTETNWPDFTPECFVEALKDFGKRKRRFGGLDNK